MSSLDLALIGNCTLGALVDSRARIVWACLPRFDGDPVFCSLLKDHGEPDFGFYDIELMDFERSEQSYRRNSAVLITHLYDSHGGCIEITDFVPRFKMYGRTFRPLTIMRHIRPMAGNPRIRIRLRPAYNYGAARPTITRGSNHVRYVMPDTTIRLTTDIPVDYVLEEAPIILDTPATLVLGPDESIPESVH